MADQIIPAPVVVLRPGDKVLIALTEESGPEVVQHITATLRDAFPGIDFTVLDGVSAVLVEAPA